jgi:hypothetical protein
MGVKRLNLERLMVTSVAKGGTQNFQNFQMWKKDQHDQLVESFQEEHFL